MGITAEQYQAIIDTTNAASLAVAKQPHITIADLIEHWASTQPDAVFLYFEEQLISYDEVNQRAEEYARVAISKGLGKGDVVSLIMTNRPEFFYAWFGMLKLGVITAFINTQAKGVALAHAINTVDSKFLIVGSECLASVTALNHSVDFIVIPDANLVDNQFESLAVAQSALSADIIYHKGLRAGLTGADLCCYIFTSGTTGLPKASLITHSKWINTGVRWCAMAGSNRDDIFYCVLPLFHGAGLMSMFSTVIATGAPCVLRRKFSASKFWLDIANYQVTCFIYVGEICRYLTNMPAVEQEKDNQLKYVIGSGMGVDVWPRFVQRFGSHLRIYEGWGSTEANCNMANVDNTPGACGRVPFVERNILRHVNYDVETDAHIKDDYGFLIEAEPGEVGEMLGWVNMGNGTVISPFDGYSNTAANEAKLLRNVFEQGDCWFRTGDLMRCDKQRYFYFVDRIGDTFRWKSENVSTTQVEQQLSVYSDVELVSVYGVKIPQHEGRAGMAALTMRPSCEFDAKAFYTIVVDSLASYAQPQFVRVCAQMDMTETFKLRKIDYQRQGYNPAAFSDQLFVLDKANKTFSAYSVALLTVLGITEYES
jgi:fatty-acyl-CoA synthase